MKLGLLVKEQTPKLKPIVDVHKFLEEQKELIEHLKAFLIKTPRALGLAANQILVDGVLCEYRLFIERTTNGAKLIINPEIIEY